MKIITLGKTNLKVNKNGFGALPIQRISEKEAVYLLHKAFDNGINFYDTARFYTDSEEKLGAAFADRRKKVIIASKTGATTIEDFWKDLHTTLKNLDGGGTCLGSNNNLFPPVSKGGTKLLFTIGVETRRIIEVDTVIESLVQQIHSFLFADSLDGQSSETILVHLQVGLA